jgi:ParB family chromosome partitioning protein
MTNSTNNLTAIPLSKLERHPDNVRKTAATGIAELAASIERDGLLQNLTVVDGTYNKGKHWVIAGGRRLAALQLLAKQKKVAADYLVPVRVIDPADAEAVSLTENQMREAMHPIDQFNAFKAMVDAGAPIADVSARFGVTEAFVKQRLKLASVAPKLLDEYRDGSMTLEQLQAFSVTDDHDKQVEVWDEIKGQRWGNDADDIRASLLDGAVEASDKRLKFVGKTNYQKAGGAIIAADLFSDDATETVSDPELLERLALEKLQKQAAKIQKDEGLAWCDVVVNLSWNQKQEYSKAPSVMREMTEAEAKLHAELEAKLDALQKQLDAMHESDDYDYEQEELLIAEMEPLEERRDAIDEACTVPHPDALEYAGAIVTIDGRGKIDIIRNQIRQADLKKLKPINQQPGKQAGTGTSDEPAPAAASGHSEKLIRRMTAHKTMILRNAMACSSTGEMALVTTVFHMLAEDLDMTIEGCMTMHSRQINRLESLADDIDSSRAAQQIAVRECEVLEPIRNLLEAADSRGDDLGDVLFRYLSPLPVPDLLAILSVCVANRLDVVVGREGDGGKSHLVAKHMRVEKLIPNYWKATRANYLDHVSRQQIIAAVQEAVTIEASEPLFPMKKAEAAEYAEGMLVASDWLPSPMRAL